MAVRKIRDAWYADFRFMRERYRRKSPENSRRGAEAFERLLMQKLLSGESINEPTIVIKRTFKEFSKEWFKTYVVTNNKRSEQQSKETILRLHLTPFFGAMSLDEITSHSIEQYKRSHQATGAHPKTINNQLTVLKKLMHSAIEWGELETIPVIKCLKVPPCKIRFLSQEESHKLYGDFTEPYWRSMVVVGLFTGMRLGELIGLQWEDVDFEEHLVHVRRAIVRGEVTSPKSHKSRSIPMSTSLDDLLFQMREPKGLVFHQEDGNPVTPKQAECGLWRLCSRTGIKKIGWHALRHTFASQLVMKNVPMRHVQQLLGHSSIVMTERYAHLAPHTLHDAVAVLDTPNAMFGHSVGTEKVRQLQAG